MEQKNQNSYDKAPKKKTAAPAPRETSVSSGKAVASTSAPRPQAKPRETPVSSGKAAAPAPASRAQIKPRESPVPAGAEEMEQQYQYLYTGIPEKLKADMKALSGAERAKRMAALDDTWKNLSSTLAGDLARGKRALEGKNKEGALDSLRMTLSDALYSVQCRAWLQMTQGEKPSLNHFLGCLSPLAEGIKAAGNNAQAAFCSKEMREFLSSEKRGRDTQGASVIKFFLCPALLFLLWFGLIKLFSAPFMAGILAHRFWEYITYVAGVILCMGVIFVLVGGCGMNFFLSIFAGPLICGVAIGLVAMGFDLIFKLFPAGVQANFAEVSIFNKLFFGIVWLILFLASAFFLVNSLYYHGGAFFKAKTLGTVRKVLRESLPKVEEERRLYGLALETADYCEAAIRWEEGRSGGLQGFTKEEAIGVTDGVRKFLQGVCDQYDGAVKAMEAMEQRPR